MVEKSRSVRSERGPGLTSRDAADRAARRAVGVCVAVVLFAASTGCAPSARDSGDAFRGTLLDDPIAMPDFTLADTDGRPFVFRERAAGHLTLLFFGYTNCPDVCPVHMASLAAVLQRFPWDVRDRVEVVFVSTDPDRDTAERIREWLDGFAPGFIGLRGDIDEVNRVQEALGLAPAVSGPDEGGGGGYVVGHAAQVIAFSPDGKAHIVYPFGTRQADWLHDIPKLLEYTW